MHGLMTTTRRWGLAAGVILASVAVLYLLLYMYERPGGWSDRSMSKSLGLGQILEIPLGGSPEEAVRLFRKSDSMTVMHQEAVGRGKLVFLTRSGSQTGAIFRSNMSAKPGSAGNGSGEQDTERMRTLPPRL